MRLYAACGIRWHAPRERGFDDYVQVLGARRVLGLWPSMVRMVGQNVAARKRGRAMLRAALGARRERGIL